MALELDVHNIEKGLFDLFRFAFTSNCNLDDESITVEESKTLEELDPSEVLENFKDVVLNLIKFKREYKTTDKAELAQRSEQFESLLQKLEAEVRTHIRVEHQLKLHIENHQQRVDELEKKEEVYKSRIKELEDKGSTKKPTKQPDSDKFRKELEDKVKNLLEVVDKKDKSIQKSEYENARLRILLEEKVRECESLKKEVTKLNKVTPRAKDLQGSSSIDYLKRKLELNKAQQKAKEKSPPILSKEGARHERKSLGETDIGKLVQSPIPGKEPGGTLKKEEFKTGGKQGKAKGHNRSNSDQKLLCFKRTPSR